MKVVVNPVGSISVKINQPQQQAVHGTSTFVGAASAQAQIQQALDIANAASATAQTALTIASTSYSANGGLLHGNMTIAGNIIPSNANTYTLGSAQYPFRSLYVGPGTIYIDNIAMSNSNGQLTITGTNSMNVTGDLQVSGAFYGVVATVDGGNY